MIVIKHAVIVQLFFYFCCQFRVPLEVRYSTFGQMSIKKYMPGTSNKIIIFLNVFLLYFLVTDIDKR